MRAVLRAWCRPGRLSQGTSSVETRAFSLSSRPVPPTASGTASSDRTYNESLSAPDDLSFVLQTRDELRARGAFHPTLHVRSLETVPLAVGGAGLELKENARVSTLLVP